MKMTSEQQLLFAVYYTNYMNDMVKSLRHAHAGLLNVMKDFDFTEGFDFKRFAMQSLLDHIKTHHDMEVALIAANDLTG